MMLSSSSMSLPPSKSKFVVVCLLVLLWSRRASSLTPTTRAGTRATVPPALTVVLAPALSKQDDLQKTIQVILGNLNNRGKKQKQIDEYEVLQRALLRQRLVWERRQAKQRGKAVQREASQRALLTTRLTLEIKARHKQAKAIADEKTSATIMEKDTQYDDVRKLLESDYAAALIRIATAATPSQQLRPKHVQSLSILQLDDEKVEIAVVVGEPDGTAVSVAVPVPFPTSLAQVTKQHFCDAVIRNIQQLDQKAYAKIAQAEWQEDQTNNNNDRFLANTLQQAPAFRFGGDLPEWWKTGDVELQRECDGLKSILNEDDFQVEVRSLAQAALHVAPQEWITQKANVLQVTQAAVALVGSAGLFLRANVQDTSDFSHCIVAVAVPFNEESKTPCFTTDALRAAVLGLMDSVATPS